MKGGLLQVMRRSSPVSLTLLLASLLVAPACSTENTPTSPSRPLGTITVESFTGTLTPGGSRFYSFTAPRPGLVLVTLVDLREGGVPSSQLVSVGLGTPAGTGCAATTTVSTAAGASPQITAGVDAGVMCVRIADLGFLSSPATFAINIARPE